MKQTAVEWLIEKILSIPLEEATNVAHLKEYVNKLEVFEQAKEMEKKQMKNTFVNSRKTKSKCDVWNCKGDEKQYETFEQYYNETFNK